MKKALGLLALVLFAAASALAQTGGETHGGFASPVVPVQPNLFTWLLLFIMMLRSLLRF